MPHEQPGATLLRLCPSRREVGTAKISAFGAFSKQGCTSLCANAFAASRKVTNVEPVNQEIAE